MSKIVHSYIKTLKNYQESPCPVLYWACGSELSLLELCEFRWKNQVKFGLPRSLNKNGEMEVYEANLDEMEFDCFEIPSPAAKNIILPQDIDCIFVPGLAFDTLGNRLGQGGGYYDRFLKSCINAVKVGVCFSVQISQKVLIIDEHDEKMDFIISEKGVIKC